MKNKSEFLRDLKSKPDVKHKKFSWGAPVVADKNKKSVIDPRPRTVATPSPTQDIPRKLSGNIDTNEIRETLTQEMKKRKK